MPSPDETQQQSCFDEFHQATSGLGRLHSIGDSKKLFKPGVAGSLDALRFVTWASMRTCGYVGKHLRDFLATIAENDLTAIAETPWLSGIDDVWEVEQDRELSAAADKVWSTSSAKLVAIRVRMIPAKHFNEACASGLNKSDLLSSSTLGLVADLVNVAEELAPKESRHLSVYCDRHGGRRFYGGLLQHTFPDSTMEVESESSQQSIYRLARKIGRTNETMQVRFTVKGDAFLPVSLSSMIAKYLRECAMHSLNAYFAKRPMAPASLRPTAGYPVDAARFLGDIDPVIGAEKIDRATLIRSR